MTGIMWAVAGMLMVTCMGGAVVPLARKWSQAGLHLLVALSVGIFLGTLFLHLMPELAEPADAHAKHPPSAAEAHTEHLPSAAGGHVEHVSTAATEHADHAPVAAESAAHENSREPWVAALVGLLTLFLIEKIWLQGKSHVHLPAVETGHHSGHGHAQEHDQDPGHAHPHSHATLAAADSGSNAAVDHPPGEPCDHDPHSHDIGHARERHALVWYASFLGLSIHAVFCGVSTAAMLVGEVVPWPFVVSMLVHKASEGFSLATVIRLGGVPVKKTLGFLLLFALVSPLGMLAGGLVAEKIGPTHLGMLRGFAAGTFLYVAVYDLLPEVFHDARQRLLRGSAVVLGIVIVAMSLTFTH